MSLNTKSIAATAPLHQIAKKFGLKNEFERSPHMRATRAPDGTVVIFSKHMDLTKLLALLGNKKAGYDLRSQRELFHSTIKEKVESEYRGNTVKDIGLNNHPPLRGKEIAGMQAHAAVAAAVEQMGLKRYGIKEAMKQSVCQQARDHVFTMPPEATAGNRIFSAKVYIIKELAQNRLISHFKNRPAESLDKKIKELNNLCGKIEFSPLAMNLNEDVMTGLISLLKTDETPTIDNLLGHVVTAKNNRHNSANQAVG